MRAALPAVLRRAAAYGVDVVLLAVVLVPLTIAVQAVVGYRPDTGIGVWIASLVCISVPSWTYFIMGDVSTSGATLGKRLLGLRAIRVGGERLGLGSAVARTAVKLIPWEVTHLAMFALAPELGSLGSIQIALLWVVYGLLAAYLFVALRRGGERSVHDLVAGSAVRSVA